MKQIIYYFILAVCALAITLSCSKETRYQDVNEAPAGFENVVFSATGEAVKTSLGQDGKSVSWIKDDQVKFVWGAGSEDGAVALASASGSTANFSVTVPEKAELMYAVSPASALSAYDSEIVTVNIPSETDGSFAAANITMAKAEKAAIWPSSITFKNITAVLKIDVTNENITSLAVSAVGGESLVGTIAASISSGVVSASVPEGAQTSSSATIAVDGAGSYYLAVVPGVTYSKGIRVDFTLSEGELPSYYYNPATALEATLGKIISFSSLDTRVGAYYVTVAGAGNKMGKSWENAMDIAAFKALVGKKETAEETAAQAAQLKNAKIYFSAETFDMGDCVTVGFPGQSADVPFEFVGKINGTDTTTFTGANTHRLLTVDGDYAALSISNVVFCNSAATSGGQGAIRLQKTSAKLMLTDCVLRDNVNTAAAGAIYSGNGTLVLNTCTIKNNKSTNGAGINIDGNATVTVNNCKFSGNEASQYGGAIGFKKGKLTINGGSFIGNTATKQGGAVYVTTANAEASISNAEFSGNGKCTDNDEGQGGAIWSAGGAKTGISGCTFEKNSARVGGAIGCANDSSNSNTITIDNCSFNKNSSTGVAGAVIMTSKGSFTITNSTFTGNTAGGNGGAIRGDQANATLTLDNVVLKDNVSSGNGGAMYIDNGKYRFNKCCFDTNKASNSGAVYAGSTSTVYMNSCLFTGNYITSTNGTTMRAWSANVTLCMNNCTFADNTYSTSSTSGKNSSWMYIKNQKLLISNSTLIGYSRKGTGGSATDGGDGLVYFDGSGVTSTVTFINNIIAHSNGKDVFTRNAGTVTLNAISNKVTSYKGVTANTSGTEGSGFKGNSTYFKELTYVSNASPVWNNCYWKWNGSLKEDLNTEKDTATNIIEAINDADSNFKAWLDTVEGLTKDGQGNARPASGSWWPGSYQGE